MGQIRWINSADFKMHGVKCMIFGPAGGGKTRLISTAPAPFVISAESGLLSISDFNVPGAEVSTMAELQDVYKWIIGSKEAKQFYTFCIDSASEIAEVVLTYEKTKTRDGRKAYGETQDKMVKLFRDFRDIKGPHIYFSAKEERLADGMNQFIYSPLFPGNKLSQNVPYLFDELFQIQAHRHPESGQKIHMVRTSPTDQYLVKDRSGKLGEWEPANLTHIFQKMLA